ncbi:hypothetical protein FB470_000110 [Amycolatopsis thermophila]|uniref:Uncharacterized protein n=1 Tax=Amycolatopsis thermophila TaxID=206084 RepID=A0ABU0EM44_9PSEU|nr:hypothetical protein [Amycolatopsis thermophila]
MIAPLVVGRHQLQEQPVEPGPRRGLQRGRLLLRRHPGHGTVIHLVVRVLPRHLEPALPQPRGHRRDLRTLRRGDPRREARHVLPRGTRRRQRTDPDRLPVVHDHPLQVGDIRVVVRASSGPVRRARRAPRPAARQAPPSTPEQRRHDDPPPALRRHGRSSRSDNSCASTATAKPGRMDELNVQPQGRYRG